MNGNEERLQCPYDGYEWKDNMKNSLDPTHLSHLPSKLLDLKYQPREMRDGWGGDGEAEKKEFYK